MPKISAPTVAAHRHAQLEALLAATKTIISEDGVAAVSPRSVGERAGLARTSFYEYFPSRDDLLAAVALQAFDEWAAEIGQAVAAAPTGRARLHTYVETTMRMTADGKHSLATDLRAVDLSPKSHEMIMAMHDNLSAPLRAVLDELGVDDAATHAALVQGLLNAGVQLIANGASEQIVTASITSLIDSGLRS